MFIRCSWFIASLVISLTLLAPTVSPTAELEAQTDTVMGTVKDVKATPMTLETITGISLALRVVKLDVDEDCEIRMAGRDATFHEIQQGQVVLVEYVTRGSEMIAHRIEVLQRTGGRR